MLGSTFLLLLKGFLCWGVRFYSVLGSTFKGVSVLGIIKRGFCAGEYVFVIIKGVSVLGSTFLFLLKGFLCWGVVRFCCY